MDRNKIRDTLSRRPWYELIERDVFQISRRICEIDPDYFIVFNCRSGKYEVHNTGNIGGTYCFTVPYDELDARTLNYCRETLVSRDVAARIEAHNERLLRSKKRTRDNMVSYCAEEFGDRMAYAVEEDQLHAGYQRSHMIGGGVKGETT